VLQVYMIKRFAHFVKKERLELKALHEAIKRAEAGLIDADLGSGLIKQRVARQGKGRSGGYRTIIAYRQKSRAVFLYGFAKNEKGNIAVMDLVTLKRYAQLYLEMSPVMIGAAVETGELQELKEDA
jgi:hypothetical protein